MRVIVLVLVLLLHGCSGLKGGGGNRVNIPPPVSDPLEIDLAKLPTDSAVVPVSAGTYSVQLVNLAPAQSYSITVEVTSTIPSPVDLPRQEPETKIRFRNESQPTACELLQSAMTDLRNEEDETKVPMEVARIGASVEDCDDPILREEAERRIQNTRRMIGPISVEQGQILNVRIARRNDPQVRWVRSYSGGRRGEWRATYGFNYIWNVFSPERRFFLEETGTAGSYLVREQRSQDRLTLAPSLFYTWMPADDDLDSWSSSPTVGLGFDLQAPVVSAGWAWTYNHNATFSLGLSLHQIQRLNEQFTVGETVTTIKTADALHRGVYRVNPYVAVTIRSITNPFQRTPNSPP